MTAAGRPSWVDPIGASAAGAPARGFARPPASLLAAGAGALVLVAVEAVHVAGRDDLRPAMRGALVAVVVAQVALAGFALRRSSAAVMLLLLCTATAVVGSLAGGAGAGRLAVAGLGAAVSGLLLRSLRWFPGADL